MSESNKTRSDPSNHDNNPFLFSHQEINVTTGLSLLSDHESYQNSCYNHLNPLQNFNYPPYLGSFTEYLDGFMDYEALSRSFDMSVCSSSEMPSASTDNKGCLGKGSGCDNKNSNNPSTPNSSSASLSSNNEDVAKEDEEKCKEIEKSEDCEDPAEKSKKVSKQKKKEKREKQPRYAFFTKSEVDNLEDGYRWRKYGQKAVKNSPFPRSYYRCTSPHCTVKKRVERSYEDQSTVITTYEGQHNHLSPALLRNYGGLMSSPSSLFALRPSFTPQEFLLSHLFDPTAANSSVANATPDNPMFNHSIHPYNHFQFPNYGG